jgi:hypothetical protein
MEGGRYAIAVAIYFAAFMLTFCQQHGSTSTDVYRVSSAIESLARSVDSLARAVDRFDLK